MRRLAALLGVLGTVAFTGAAASAPSTTPFLVGFSDDLPKEIGSAAVAPAAELGGRAFRLTTLWEPGQTALAAAEAAKLDRATSAASGQRLVLAVYASAGTKAPQDAAGRTAYCTYVQALLARYPSIRDVVIWNEPNKNLFWSPQAGAPAAYEALLARCYDLLPASVNVIGLALSSTGNDDAGSTSPGAFIRGVGDAYRTSGRTARLFDTVAHHPYGLDAAERPWRKHIAAKPIGLGDWNKLMYNLYLAFDGTAQPLPGEEDVRIWYTESGSQTAVDAGKSGYTGAENVATVPDDAGGEPETPAPPETSAAPDQRTQALDAIRLAACQPGVAAYFNFLLADEPRLEGWQSGPLWVDRTPKDSWPAFRQAIAAATSGSVDCDTLKGGPPSADFLPPSVPSGLSGMSAPAPLRVELTWNPASDASALTYRVFRNGAHVATTAATSWTNGSVAPGTAYTYAVRALDAAGNLGEASAPLVVTTPAEPVPPPAPGGGGGGGGAPPPDLGVAVATMPAPARAGAPVNAIVTVFNDAGAGTASSVAAAIELPAGAVLLGPVAYERGSGCAGTSPTTCALDFLPGGWSTTLRLSFLPAVPGTLVAAVSTPDAEPDVGDNRAALEVLAQPVATAAPASAATRPPAAPARVRAATRKGKLTLTWSPSADAARVRSYLVFRDGVLRRSSRGRRFTERILRGRHVYAVRALGLDGRRSAAKRIVVRG